MKYSKPITITNKVVNLVIDSKKHDNLNQFYKISINIMFNPNERYFKPWKEVLGIEKQEFKYRNLRL